MALFVEERRRLILEQLRQQGRVSVQELSQKMQVSAVTIRQDLGALEADGLLERTYGGAVRHTNALVPELSFHVRLGKHSRTKEAVAAAAAALVEDGFTVGLDASTTVYAMVDALKRLRRLTVVTNSLIIAQSFLDSPHVQVLMPGGRMRRDSISIVGRLEGLPDVNMNIGFFGARGISLVEGLTDVDADEAQIKAAMAGRCVVRAAVIDGSKWGQVAPYTFIKPQEISRVVTADDAPLEMIEQFRERGTAVDVVTTQR